MSQPLIPLESVRIASPCKASWENMEGDDKARFCLTCHKNVYNLSAMSRAEAEALIREKEGSLCIRFYQRSDCTMLTANCPVGLRFVQRPFKWLAAGAALLVATGVALATGHAPAGSQQGAARYPQQSGGWRSIQPIKMIMDWFDPPVVFMGGSANAMTSDASGLEERHNV
jgi:hypothetical protein